MMIKAPQFSPLILLLSLRAAKAVAQEYVASPGDLTRALPGLRGLWEQPDRPLLQWFHPWPASAKESLKKAWQDPMVQAALHGPVGTLHAVIPSLPALPWTPSDEGLTAHDADAVLRRQDQGQEVWLEVPLRVTAWQAWNKTALERSLRLGAAWSCPAPAWGDDAWDEFIVFLSRMTPVLMETPHANQWVHPWAPLMQQVLMDVFRQGIPQSRAQVPEGAARGDWGKAKRALAQHWSQCWGGSPQAEEILAGIVVYALHQGWSL